MNDNVRATVDDVRSAAHRMIITQPLWTRFINEVLRFNGNDEVGVVDVFVCHLYNL
jgi:hypothetical protein